MKQTAAAIALFAAMHLLAQPPASVAHELSGYVSAEGRFFFNDPVLSEQERDNGSFAFQPEYYHEWENGSAFLFVPFGRLDSADSERTHFDIRELNYLWPTDDWEVRLGVGKIFWGATEFVHLVDIINQTDLVENIDEEDKLGQPMVHFSVPRDWGVLDLFLLPYFRERTFPGRKGRLRIAQVVDTDHPIYESDSEEHHADFAARYSNTVGDWDFGIYHFVGTGREPTLLPGIDEKGRAIMIPFYEQINQTGLDVQLVAGQWLWKLESIYRTGQGDSLFASVAGSEYSIVGVAESGMDLGLLGEYAFDDRRDDAPTVYENDLMVGLRLAVNDADGSEILAGLIQDLDSRSRALSVEASRRFGSNWKLSLQAWGFLESAADDLLFNVRDDDFLQIELAYYF
jgi:hypothetical protein